MTRLLDIILSFFATVVISPFMIPIMIGLKCTGEHDIFYKQKRAGRCGKPFYILKFATMLRNSPNLPGGLTTMKNDPRMLPMGPFLRKTKINELPQLLNILFGDMSIIGFRPVTVEQYKLYSKEFKSLALKTKQRPGLSGIGSIVFRDEEAILWKVEEQGMDKDKFYREVIAPYKCELEIWYMKHRNVFTYVKLIMLTVDAVLNPGSRRWEKELKGLPAVPENLKGYI
jgi:lipopolysaccharide/colanic/teichoic acid biosynthesis glycosyltransferase